MSTAELTYPAIHSQITLPLLLQGMELDTHEDTGIDLNDYLIRSPDTTVLTYTNDDAMIAFDVHNGDLLVVDRAVPPQHNDIVVAGVEDSIVCRKLDLKRNLLHNGDDDGHYLLSDYADLFIVGVVMHAIHPLR